MDKKLVKRILHDLNLMEDEHNDLHVEIQVSMTGKDVSKMQVPNTLARYYSLYIRQTFQNIDLYGLSTDDLKKKAKETIKANK